MTHTDCDSFSIECETPSLKRASEDKVGIIPIQDRVIDRHQRRAQGGIKAIIRGHARMTTAMRRGKSNVVEVAAETRSASNTPHAAVVFPSRKVPGGAEIEPTEADGRDGSRKRCRMESGKVIGRSGHASRRDVRPRRDTGGILDVVMRMTGAGGALSCRCRYASMIRQRVLSPQEGEQARIARTHMMRTHAIALKTVNGGAHGVPDSKTLLGRHGRRAAGLVEEDGAVDDVEVVG